MTSSTTPGSLSASWTSTCRSSTSGRASERLSLRCAAAAEHLQHECKARIMPDEKWGMLRRSSWRQRSRWPRQWHMMHPPPSSWRSSKGTMVRTPVCQGAPNPEFKFPFMPESDSAMLGDPLPRRGNLQSWCVPAGHAHYEPQDNKFAVFPQFWDVPQYAVPSEQMISGRWVRQPSSWSTARHMEHPFAEAYRSLFCRLRERPGDCLIAKHIDAVKH